jgi:RHS repeat-associated protein
MARRLDARARAAVVLFASTFAIEACHGNRGDGGNASSSRESAVTATSAASAAQILAALQAAPGSPLQAGIAQGFDTVSGSLRPQISTATLSGEPKPASLLLPQTCSAAAHLQDVASGLAVDVSLVGALPVAAQTTGGYVVYPAALGPGTHVLHRALPSGTEDFVALPARPTTAEIDYSISLGAGVAGLRLVGGLLEFVDAGGAPRLRISPPFIVGSDGARTDGALAVSDCAVDTDPSGPWGRAATAPGASRCTLRVTWPDANVVYPAILDPRWTTTGSMITARYEHTLTLIASTGKVLVAGGRSSTGTTTGLTSAELYDKTTGVWSATGAMANARRLHGATQLNTGSNSGTSGRILISGGISGSTSLTSAELYSPSAGTFSAAGTLNTARHLHTATLLADGRVLAAGGMAGTTTLASAALYNPASGSGSWVATTGPIPPAGWRYGTATLIQTSNSQLANKVLLVGGNDGSQSLSAVYLFDPVQSAFSTLASIPSPAREQHFAVTLPGSSGKILVAGGKSGSTVLATAIVFDPSSGPGSWSTAGTMTSARVGASAIALPGSIVANGLVLVAGGSSTGSNTLSSAELFSDSTTWTATPSMPGTLQGAQAVLLGNNQILVAGGLSSSSTVASSAYLYDASFGLGCSSNSQCASGFCVNGICCDTACNTGTCEACNLAGHLGTCTPLASGTVCRASAGTCDVVETCNGTAVTCPADGFQPSTTVCRPIAGECDIAENCTGTSAACPVDAKKASGTACTDDGNVCTTDKCDGTNVTCQHAAGNAGTQCRAAADVCDLAATCTGSSTTCPPNGFKPSGTSCPDDGNVCTTDTCSGSSAICQHPAGHAGTQCRAAADVCDLAATCTGSSTTCPPNGFKASGTSCPDDGNVCTADTCNGTSAICQHPAGHAGTQCRAAADVCDLAATCTGSSTTCPPNGFKPSGTSCPDDGNVCTTDTCNGTSAVCQHPAGHAGTICRAIAGACDVAETCTGASSTCPTDSFAPPTTVCRPSAGQCDVAENCTGSSAACPTDSHKPNGTTCDDGQVCTQTETCQGGSCQAPTQFPVIVDLPADDLGTLGAPFATASDVNSAGYIVGVGNTASGDSHAFLKPPGAPLVDLGIQPGFPPESSDVAIADSGVIAGNLQESDGSHVFRYSVTTGIEDLGVGGDDSQAIDGLFYRGAYTFDINSNGQVAGILTDGSNIRGFRYTDGKGFEELGTLGGASSRANALDEFGTVFGSAQLGTSPPTGYRRLGHAVKFDDSVGLFDLNNYLDPSLDWTLIAANDATHDYVVGGGDHAGIIRPFRLHVSEATVDEITGGWEGESYATGVNSFGDTVGWGYIDAAGEKQAAFVYTDQLGFKKLNDLIDPTSGWDLNLAAAINDAGDVVGWGHHNGQVSAFHLSVSPQNLACGEAQNSCGPSPGAVCIWADGVVDLGGNHFVAVFGYQNSGPSNATPAPNQVLLDGSPIPNPVPAPPTSLVPGEHPDAFLPTFDGGHAVSWKVNSQTVTASTALHHLTPTPELLALHAPPPSDLTLLAEGIATINNVQYAVFGYQLPADAPNVSVPYGLSNNLVTDTTTFIAQPQPVPPVWFTQGTHHGALVYPLGLATTLTWTVGTSVKTIGPGSPSLDSVHTTDGDGVMIDGFFVDIVPNPAAPLVGAIVSSAVPFPQPGLPATVGDTPGTFDVSSDGAAQYSIPLWVPPGRAGMQPEVTVRYNSRSPDGELGVGFSNSAESMITRCPANTAQDGYSSRAGFSAIDPKFCLDGLRLILVSGNGGNGSVYRLERDTLAKITKFGASDGNPDSFEVRLKDGRILTYGGDDADWDADVYDHTVSPPQLLFRQHYAWSLKQVRDRAGGDTIGNNMIYSYSNPTIFPTVGTASLNGAFAHVLTTISYTGYGAALGTRLISLVDDPTYNNQDLAVRYYEGMALAFNSRRVGVINMTGPSLGPDQTAPTITQSLLRTYRFAYEQSPMNNRSRLITVNECDGQSVCKPVTRFKWEDGSTTFHKVPVDITSFLSQFAQGFGGQFHGDVGMDAPIVADLNGDGYADIVGWAALTQGLINPNNAVVTDCSGPDPFISGARDSGEILFYCTGGPNGAESCAPFFSLPENVINPNFFYDPTLIWFRPSCQGRAARPPLPRVVDLNGDGLLDLVAYDPVADTWKALQAFTSDGTPTGALRYAFVTFPTLNAPSTTGPPARLSFADINGDGLPEMFSATDVSGGQTRWHVWKNLGGSFIDYPTPGVLPYFSDTAYAVPRLRGDNASGFLAQVDGGGFLGGIQSSNGATPELATSNLPVNTGYGFMDVNGDGLADAVLNGQLFVNSAEGFLAESFSPPIANPQPFDYNEDGIVDVLDTDPNAPAFRGNISDPATGAGTPFDLLDDTGHLIGTGPAKAAQLLDVNADGLTDVVRPSRTGFDAYVRNGNKADQILNIFQPLGAEIDVTYGPLAPLPEGQVINHAFNRYPIHPVNSGPWVVTMVARTTSQTERTEETYAYGGGVVDIVGRGWLGFDVREVNSFDIAGLMKTTVTHYNTNEGMAGPDVGATSGTLFKGGLGSQVVYPFTGRPFDVEETSLNFGVTHFKVDNIDLTISAGQADGIHPYTVDIGDIFEHELEMSGQQHLGDTFYVRKVFTYDQVGHGNVTTEVDQFNESASLTDQSDAVVTVSDYMNDESSWLISQLKSRTVTDSSGEGPVLSRTTTIDPDSSTGLAKLVTTQPNGGSMQLSTSYSRNGYGLPTTVTAEDANGEQRTTTYSYDLIDGTFGTSVTNAVGQVARTVFHPGLGVPVLDQDVNGQATKRQFDGFGRLRSQSMPDGSGVTIGYHVGRPEIGGSYAVTTQPSGGGLTTITYDLLGREILHDDTAFGGGATNSIGTAYDAGHPKLVAFQSSPTTTLDMQTSPGTFSTYDFLGRIVQKTLPEGLQTRTTYTYAGPIATRTDARGNVVKTTTDTRGRIRQVDNVMPADANGPARDVVTTYHYGAFGTTNAITTQTVIGGTPQPGSSSVSIGYDALGRRTSLADPDAGSPSFAYNGFGDLISATDGNGVTTTRTPDPIGRLASESNTDGETTYTWDAAPNGIGKIAATLSPSGVLRTFAYRADGRTTSEGWSILEGAAANTSYAVDYDYDTSGRLRSQTYPAVGASGTRLTLTREYDDASGKLKSVSRNGLPVWTVTQRDAFGGVEDDATANGFSTVRTVDPASGLLSELKTLDATGTLVRQIDYAYDAMRNVDSRTTDGQVETFCYDTLNRLSGWAHSQTGREGPGLQYLYDDLGNMLTKNTGTIRTDPNVCATTALTSAVTFTAGGSGFGPHQVSSSSFGPYGYDGNGNQTTAPGRSISYTTFNLPSTFDGPAGQTRFLYDAAHVRTVKETNSSLIVSIGGLYEKRVAGSGTADIFYVQGEGAKSVAQIEWTEALGQIVGDETTYIYDDALGSTQTSANGAGQLETFSYEPFGSRISGDGSEIRLGFVGQEQDDELGLINMGGRIYDPILARFLNPDPLVQAPLYGQSYNRYAYAWNNPLRVTDPSGFEDEGDLEGLDGLDEDVEAMFADSNTWSEEGLGDLWAPGNFGDASATYVASFNADNGFNGGTLDTTTPPPAPFGASQAGLSLGNYQLTNPLNSLIQDSQSDGPTITPGPLAMAGYPLVNRSQQDQPSVYGVLKWSAVGLGVGLVGAVGLTATATFVASLELTAPTLALGRMGAEVAASLTFGYEYFRVCDECWNLGVNLEAIETAIQQGYRFYLASPPTWWNLFNEATQELTIYGQEVMYLLDRGFLPVGRYLMAPPGFGK